jgi:hypothetical protein
MAKADLHIHSIYSPDAISKPESILEMAVEKGIDVIAITDHDTANGWDPTLEASKYYPVNVVLGQEIKVYKDNLIAGELICLFLEKPLPVAINTIPDVIAAVAEQEGLVSIAHPFSERRSKFRGFDQISDWQRIAIEVINGRSYNLRDNEMAEIIAEKLDTLITAGSDAHTPFEIGNVYLEFEGKSIDDLKKSIIHHDVCAHGRSSSPVFSVVSEFGRLGLSV